MNSLLQICKHRYGPLGAGNPKMPEIIVVIPRTKKSQ
jgi:hypothetical protein